MRSAEIARLAGVTVRTLRHYHQMGVLAEPLRTSNGYRDYSIQHLVRVLRIRQLSGLGVPLDQMSTVLDAVESDEQSSVQLLDELDQELAQQIERLTAQLGLIAQLRSHGVSPDMPAELAPFYALSTVAGYRKPLAQMDRDQAVLLSHFSSEAGKVYLSALYEQLSQRPELVTASEDFTRRFEALNETSSDEQITDLIGDFVASLAEVVSSLMPDGQVIELGRAVELLNEYGAEAYNEPQRKTLTLLAQRFAEPD